ncbi:MAG: hypothetical protein Phog2KO_38450 [Phototrophicaceae bacterium]
MKILLLEDNPNRIKYFKNGLKNHHLTVCTHAKSAKKALKKAQFDIIFLDHDLRGYPEDPESDNCGSEIAHYIIAREIGCPHIILHTENPIGREAMEDILLDRCETIPYSQVKKIGLRELLKGIIDEH